MTTERVNKLFHLWMNDPLVNEYTKEELRHIQNEPAEREDRFYKDLEFGTGGLRGIIGAGTNRMNIYTIARASQGLASFIQENSVEDPSIVIAYDSRNMSPEFALEAALVCAGNGIKAYLFTELRPTPELSFAVRYLKASAGIVITASHNPPEYNGFKVYGADGGQLVTHDAAVVIEKVQEIQNFEEVKRISRETAESNGLFKWINHELDQAYIQEVIRCSPRQELIKHIASDLHIVYTPLHGAGNLLVRQALKGIGFNHVHIVAEQELPDAQFSTVRSPNPEEKEAFVLAMAQAKHIDADIIIGTDPDCDRMGAVVTDKLGQHVVLSGNQIGALILYYLLSSLKEKGELPQDGVVIKTIVTSEFGKTIATQFGIETINTLTGFKYIAEKMTQFEKEKGSTFIFGYEESHGYLAGNYARDKDAVLASMLICEAAAYYKKQGKSLLSVLQELYTRFGYYMEKQESKTLKGKDGVEKIKKMMDTWRFNPINKINGVDVIAIEDYGLGIHGLPQENVLKYKLADESWFCLRPSGTEPKIKFYFAVKDETQEAANSHLDIFSKYVINMMN